MFDQGSDPNYSEATAIVIIVFNGLSFLALLFVLIIYFLNWKIIKAFPMRLVYCFLK